MGIRFYNRHMTRAISVRLGLGTMVTAHMAAGFPSAFHEQAAMQEMMTETDRHSSTGARP